MTNLHHRPSSGTTSTGIYYKPPRVPATKLGRPKNEEFTVSGVKDFPEVIVSAVAHGKMLALIQECDIEIGWLCSITRNEQGDFLVNDVYVPAQKCSAASTDLTEEGEADMLMELLTTGKSKEAANLKCWGHSHVDMPVYASKQDEDTTQEFVKRFKDHFIRFIGNKHGELLCHVYLIEQGFVLNNPDMTLLKDDVDYRPWARDQIDTKVTEFFLNYQGQYPKGMYSGAADWDTNDFEDEPALEELDFEDGFFHDDDAFDHDFDLDEFYRLPGELH